MSLTTIIYTHIRSQPVNDNNVKLTCPTIITKPNGLLLFTGDMQDTLAQYVFICNIFNNETLNWYHMVSNNPMGLMTINVVVLAILV